VLSKLRLHFASASNQVEYHTMSLNSGFLALGAEDASSPKKKWKFVGYFVGSFTATLLLVALTNINNSRPLLLNAVGIPSTRLGAPRVSTQFSPAFLKSQGIGSSDMSRLAIAGIEQANQCRDISAKATNQVMQTLASMDGPERRQVARMVQAAAVKAEDMSGVTAPMGFFDPAGFSTDIDTGKLLFYREVELKHGRICMLAALGILVGENFHPLFGGNIDAPAYVAFQQTPLEVFWPIVVAAIAVPEIASFSKYDTTDTSKLWILNDDAVPGDFGFDPLGLKPTDPEAFKEMQTKELNNGRLAMFAAAGMIGQELATGQKLF
jgi:hypothetical protein